MKGKRLLLKGQKEKASACSDEAESVEISSTTISNIKLYNLVRDSLISNASPSPVVLRHILKNSFGRGEGREVDFKINYLLMPLTFL